MRDQRTWAVSYALRDGATSLERHVHQRRAEAQLWAASGWTPATHRIMWRTAPRALGGLVTIRATLYDLATFARVARRERERAEADARRG